MSKSRFPLIGLVLLLACNPPATSIPDGAPITVAPSVEPKTPEVERVRADVLFLADDARGGRAPGSDEDRSVQRHVADAMSSSGLHAAGTHGFVQPFVVTDGVRVRQGERSALGDIPHALVPFGHDTGTAPVNAKMVFVGDGIELDVKKVRGQIVVALAGAEDPHAPIDRQRPQAKLIAARDLGAVGFVLWDPEHEHPVANHGTAQDNKIPAVAVGKAGTERLLAAFAKKPGTMPKKGTASKHPIELATPIDSHAIETANVIGRLPGSEGKRTIVIGAHMDHLGRGTSGSLAPDSQDIHNGADDNASGVAVMLEVARVMASMPAEHRPHDLVFVAFGAEEMGLLGSKHMVENMTADERAKMLAMLNFDMVGRLREKVTISGNGTAKEMPAIIEAARGDLAVAAVDDGWGPSDHSSFYAAGIPVLHFFTGAHEDYHKPSDDIDKVDFAGATKIAAMAVRVTEGLMDHSTLAYVEVAKPQQAAGGFRVSLGTIPDYSANVDGLRLDGVRKGGAAERAGLRKGDVIVRIGQREVHNIDDYMAAFAEMLPKTEVEIEVEREGKRQVMKLVPDAPR